MNEAEPIVDQGEARFKRGLRWTTLGCGSLLVLAVAVPYILSNLRAGSLARLLPAELSKLRSIGVPVTAEELPVSVAPLDKRNAAHFYRELFKELAIFRSTSSWQQANQAAASAINRGKRATNHPAVKQWIANHQGFLTNSARLSSFQSLNFNRNYRLGMGLQLEEVGFMRDLAKWQSYRATLAAQAGDARTALESIETVFAISRHAGQDNAIIQIYNACLIDELGHGALKEFVVSFKSRPAELAKARRLLEAVPDHVDLQRGLYGELVLGRATIRDLRDTRDIASSTFKGGATTGAEPQILDKYSMRNSNVRAMFDYKYLDLWSRVFEKMPKDKRDWRGMRNAYEVVEQGIRSAKAPEDALNALMFPSLKAHANACGMVQARYRLALLSIRILENPIGPPANLDQFKELAVDPMDGKPLRFIRSGRAFKLWSVGANERDDKGSESVAGNPSKNVDLVYRFGLPPLAAPPARTSTPIRPGGPTP